MRKITSLVMLLMLMASAVWAQGTPVRVTSLDQIKQDKCYTITAPRSALCVASADAAEVSTLFTSKMEADAKDPRQQFAFVENGGKYYLYSVAAQKFVDSNKRLNASPVNAVYFEKGNPYVDNGVNKEDRPEAVKMNMGTDKVFNIGGSNQFLIDDWNTTDVGNSFYVEEAGNITPVVAPEVDTSALPQNGKNYYFYNKHLQGDQYFYDNSGVVGFGAQKMEKRKSYVWTCEEVNGNYYFKNLGSGQYFAWKSLSATACEWALSTAKDGNSKVTNEGCVSMQAVNQSGSNYLVCKQGVFDQARNAGFYNETFSSDFKFELCTNSEWENEEIGKIEYYSQAYGDNWVRLVWDRNTGDAAGLAATASEDFTGMAAKSNAGDMAGRDQLWSLVGNENGFYLQNAVAGADLALTVASATSGAEATFVAKEEACSWVLVDKGGSFAIAPADNKNLSLNSFGGPRKDLKLYDANDGGSKWQLITNLVEGIKISTFIDGENPYGDQRVVVGSLNFSINGRMNNSAVYSDAAGESIYYLPAKAKVVMTQANGGRGFANGGFKVNGKAADKVEFTVGEQTGEVKAFFKASIENGVVLYFTPDPNGKPYRIPAIATAKNGDLFAISDNRPCGSDIGYGEVDVKCRISKDNGLTWGEEFFVADGVGDNNGGQVWKTGFGDAAFVADRERNELLVMMVCGKTVCWDANYSQGNPNRVAQVRAKLNEKTGEWEWTAPVEVTETIYPLFKDNGKVTVESLFIGSGRICQSRVTKVGDYYRLYCATWTKNEGNRVIYSDDFGKTWHILGTVNDRPGKGGDEPKCEEMPNGNVVLSSRRDGRLFNIFTYSNVEKGEGQWQTEEWSETREGGIQVGNTTNGEIMMLKAVRVSDGQKVDLALQSVPFGGGRNNVGFFFKAIDEEAQNSALKLAENWTKGLQVSYVGSAYSTMTLQKDNKIGFFFEEEPGNYCMVYIPLTVEAITKGEFKLDEESYQTGIGEVLAPQTGVVNNAVYDLSGRRVSCPEKGVYIVNGKKVILK